MIPEQRPKKRRARKDEDNGNEHAVKHQRAAGPVMADQTFANLNDEFAVVQGMECLGSQTGRQCEGGTNVTGSAFSAREISRLSRREIVLISESIGEFLCQFDFLNLVPAQRLAEFLGSGGITDRAGRLRMWPWLARKAGGAKLTPRGSEFIMRIDAHHAHDECDGPEEGPGPLRRDR